ncbi:HIRAN domain-containing protein [Sulfuricella sp.]|uniref:HIRAN domain-containing protein n=1 Tax=Sulfuricella sp. TaxID=2099377 RepID=UPI002B942E72|nr:HIRAN domain-containing protein [Sulfuricella sp.]HUX65088.1 HIRAN domain-containing protein [Sulfuricella sp.]
MRLHLVAALLLALTFSLPTRAAEPTANAKILLQNSPLAGFRYYEGKRLWSEMKVGDALQLVREPDNSHDTKAVRVEWQGHKLGYVPRADNEALARFMDRGSKAEARITRLKKSRNPWQRMEFEVYLDIANPIQEKTP